MDGRRTTSNSNYRRDISKEGQECFGRMIPPVWSRERLGFGECGFLKFQVGVKIHLCRLHGFVSQPQRDDRPVHSVLQQVHRRGMAEHVRRDPLGFE